MTATKHKLTVKTDKITGDSGSDLFIGALKNDAPTLNDTDILNGGKGNDTIQATLVDGSVSAVMKNIERGIFTLGDFSNANLGLTHASQMTDLTFKLDPDNHDDKEVTVEEAGHVSSLTMQLSREADFELDVDPAKVRNMTVSFDDTRSTQVSLIAETHAAFRSIHVNISDTDGGALAGNSIGANKLFVNSEGTVENYLSIDPGMNTHVVRNVVITGSQDLDLYSTTDGLFHLRSFDTTGMSGNTWSTIGGDALDKVSGGSHNEVLDMLSIGGSQNAPAMVNLGAGIDSVQLNYAFDAETQRYNGGKDYDTLELKGAAADLNTAVKGFEEIYVTDATGTYDVKGLHLINFDIANTTGITTVDQLANNATLAFYDETSNFFTVNVANADSSTTDSLRVLLSKDAAVGTQIAGFSAPSLSNLEIDSFEQDHVMYLGSVGSATDAAYVHITGENHLELHASTASTSYISTLYIDNETAGADISGLSDGNQAFVNTGATIIGGGGNDILVGGDGGDHISTGGGDNTVIGSLGADVVTLTVNSGLDRFIFNSQADSSYGSAHDEVANFNVFDTIDLSALGIDITYVGNAATLSAGEASLSNAHATAFFNQSDDTLYIDLNHDKQFTAAADMEIKLSELSGLNSGQLLL